MFPTIQIGPLALQSDGLILLLTFMLALEVLRRAATAIGLNGDDAQNVGFTAGVAGLVGARLGYVAQYWEVFRDSPLSALTLTPDALSPLAGLGAGLIAGFAYAQRKRLDNRRFLDALAPALAIVAAGVALADLATGRNPGAPSGLPWAIDLWGAPRHPVQIYYMLAAALSGVLAVRAGRPFDGAWFGLFTVLYGMSTLVLDALHESGATVGGVRTAQAGALVVVIVALLLLNRWSGPSDR
jgi:phosphatidylglycerol:prolipoprotein diacylglycerol transferase